ncbi:hypothetical protein GCM10009574_083590 [Streptomyces asiaticus]
MRVLYLINLSTPGRPGPEATGATGVPALLAGDCLTRQLSADDAFHVGDSGRKLASTAVLSAAATAAGSGEAGVR